MPDISGDILGPGILVGLGALLVSAILVFLWPDAFDGPGNASAGMVIFTSYSIAAIVGVHSHGDDYVDPANLLFATALSNLTLAAATISALARRGRPSSGIVRTTLTLLAIPIILNIYSQIYQAKRAGSSTLLNLNGFLVGLQVCFAASTVPAMIGSRDETERIRVIRRRLFTIPTAVLTAAASSGIMIYSKLHLGVRADVDGWSTGQVFNAASGFVALYCTILQGLTPKESEVVASPSEVDIMHGGDQNDP